MGQGSVLVRAHVAKANRCLGRPPDSIISKGALSELLIHASTYSYCRPDILPYAKDVVSWPEPWSKPVSLVDSLAKADSKLLHSSDSYILRGRDDYHNHVSTNHVYKPYCDPTLMSDPDRYVGFDVVCTWTVAMAHSHRKTMCLRSVLVRRRDGPLRYIFDICKLHMKFEDLPKTPQIEGPTDCELLLSAGNIRNAFDAFEVPEGLSDLFTLPVIPARYSSLTHIDGTPIVGNTLITPCLTVFPMGWNWSFHFCR